MTALALAGGAVVTAPPVALAGQWIAVDHQDSGSFPFKRAQGWFYPDVVEEQVQVCDRFDDGRTTSAQLRYHGQTQLEVTDRSGPDITCAKQNLDIPEGTPVSLRVCVQNLDCTAWFDGIA